MTRPNDQPRTVAFYLPQFHPIPENDRWWGEGFTEWRNVARARPAFDGHGHPAQASALGEYDLRDPAVMHAQAELARSHDVDAFCFYFYWFSGKRLLETPLDNYLQNGPDFPFCLSWANENWSRRWDGKDSEVLIGQDYEAGYADEVFDSLAPYLADDRYLRTADGAAILLVHRVDHVPDALALTTRWRQLARERGVGELYLVAAETKSGIRPAAYGMDAVAEFPPVGSNVLSVAQLTPPKGLASDFRGRVMSYARLANRFARRAATEDYVRHRGVVPGWDNTPRRQSKATVYIGSTPELYRRWLRRSRAAEAAQRGAEGLVFINAWNEWAEGAYLEPDLAHGDEYLRATRHDSTETFPPALAVSPGRPTWGWARSLGLAAAGSVLSAWRSLRARR